jgi:hypothetical protein
MPEFSISPRAREFALKFVSSAIEGVAETSNVSDAFNLGESLTSLAADYPIAPLNDVVDDIWKFGILRAFSLESKRDLPFVHLGDAGDIPVLQGVPPKLPFVSWFSYSYEFLEQRLGALHLKLVRVDPDSAIKQFGKLLIAFLDNRFEVGIRRGAGGGAIPPAGNQPYQLPNGDYLVELNSQKHGWSAHKSPAYGMDFTAFGAPTSPVWGYLSGGRWIFAGTRPATTQFITDTTVFEIPKTLTPEVTAF